MTTTHIQQARREQAADIARLIMLAMNHECCQYFAGPEHTLQDFHRAMTALVERDDSQYSYLNTLVAMDDEGRLEGICTAYDGAQLHRLREAFLETMRREMGREFGDMADETQAGELYIDSLAVEPRCQGRGIARQLLAATAEKARQMGIGAVGLLVDKGNPSAERLYVRVGFAYKDDNAWGGHPMRHLQLQVEG